MHIRHPWLLALLLLGACSGPSPTQAFRSWLETVERCDLEGMKASLSRQSLEQVESLNTALRRLAPKDRQATFHLLTELCRGYQKGSFEVLAEQVEGDQATLQVKTRDKTIEARMVREDQAWKLDFASLMRQAISPSFGMKPLEPNPTSAPVPAAPPPAPANP